MQNQCHASCKAEARASAMAEKYSCMISYAFTVGFLLNDLKKIEFFKVHCEILT